MTAPHTTSASTADQNPEPLWTVKEVMQYLQASKAWVYSASASGSLPSLRIGGLLRFDPAVVQAWAHGERVPATGRHLSLVPSGT